MNRGSILYHSIMEIRLCGRFVDTSSTQLWFKTFSDVSVLMHSHADVFPWFQMICKSMDWATPGLQPTH